ncbi:Ldh family oxidoreductase [Occultella kanbiaonis]|uniref:Ldh family oxidoreductase n=1 Tax=Occultella kanbiaonis TaxID=2675754 RepID=UPI0012B8AD29|nr:Ldh family oxidoreductase [Occultella kanbiaonis]
MTTNSVGTDVAVSADRLHDAVVQILVGEGATFADAAQQADVLVEGDLRGHPSHGVRRLAVLVGRMRNGLIRTGVAPRTTWISDAFLSVDGERGFGPVVAGVAIEAITRRAAESGVALAAVHNANHMGMLAPYVERIAAAGQIGIALTTSEALVHPWGSARPMVGTNPVGIAVPTESEPLVLDMSTAAVSMGKVLDHAATSRPIPLGWAVDRHGRPVTDPAEVSDGALSPFGGPKGYALGIALEVLVGTVTGTAFGPRKQGTLDVEHIATKGDIFVAISLDRIGRLPHLSLVEAYLHDVRASGTGPDPVTVPGDRARATRAERLANGIPVNPQVWREVEQLLEEHGA